MKKILLCSLLLSNSALAIVNGSDAVESEYPQFLKIKGCSGAIVAGKYVLTAAHCDKPSNTFVIHPNYQIHPAGYDIALAKLENTYPTNKVSFLSDIAVNNEDEPVQVYGWSTGVLKQADFLTRSPRPNIPKPLYLKFNNNGYTECGDSGSPVLLNKQIIAVHNGKDVGSGEDYGTITSRIEYSKKFILETVNAWHSPTELKFTGSHTIKIQSLHINNVNLALRQNNGTLTTGDVTVTGGSCVTDGAVVPFGICTLELSSTGGEGHIILDEGNTITINRAPKPAPKPEPHPSNDGGSGGSMGYLSLLGLLVLAYKRKSKYEK